jgi:nucleoside-diphosphate-sugar epimerase
MKILITGGNGNIAKIITKNLSNIHDITSLNRSELNILNYDQLSKYLEENTFDGLIHTAILGGRRTKEETSDVFYNNVLMFENILKFADKFKMIINFDSAAIYDRSTDILNRKEDELNSISKDYYGLSKYIIYQRSLQYDNIYNFRIFNLFHSNEESDRFIKSCFIASSNNTPVTIFEDKYFDFIYETDFIKILSYYLSNLDTKLEKTINICYKNKYRLSEVAQLIDPNIQLNIIKKESFNNYTGDGTLLSNLNIDLLGLDEALKDYFLKYNLSN